MSSTVENWGRSLGVGRRKIKALLACHHRIAETEGDVGNPLIGPHGGKGIEISRLRHPGEGRVEKRTVAVAGQLLDHDRHTAGPVLPPGLGKTAGPGMQRRGIDHLDRLSSCCSRSPRSGWSLVSSTVVKRPA